MAQLQVTQQHFIEQGEFLLQRLECLEASGIYNLTQLYNAEILPHANAR